MDRIAAEYKARAIKLGIFTLLAGIIANFIPAIYLALLGFYPSLGDIFRIWVVAFAAFGTSWIVQVLSYYPLLGTSGSYVSWICGSVADIRIPAATMAQKVTGYEAGTPEGDVMATMGIAVSVIVSVAIITTFTFIGYAVVPFFPKFVTRAFDFIIPAVFGAVYSELTTKYNKIGVATIVLAIAINFTGKFGVPQWLISILIITSGIMATRVYYKATFKSNNKETGIGKSSAGNR